MTLHPFPDLLDSGQRTTNEKPCFACGLPGFIEAVWFRQGGEWFCSSQCARLSANEQCALRSQCLRASKGRGAPVMRKGDYCSSGCRGRAQAIRKRERAAYIASGGQIMASGTRINSGENEANFER